MAVHRRLGPVMGVWASAMVLVGPATVVMALRRPGSGVGSGALAGDLAQTLAYVMLVGLGLMRRREAEVHKRLMLLGSAAMCGPAIVRWPYAFKGRRGGTGRLLSVATLVLAGYVGDV